MKKLVLAAVAAVGLGGSAVANDYMYYGSGSGGLEGFFLGAGGNAWSEGSVYPGGEVNAGYNGPLQNALMFGFEGVLYGLSDGGSMIPGAQVQGKLGLSLSDDAWIYKTVGAGFVEGTPYGLIGVGGEILIHENISLFGQVAAVGYSGSSMSGQIRFGFHWYPDN